VVDVSPLQLPLIHDASAVHGTLDDGTSILFRPIRADDKDALRRGFEMMSPESRYRRFFRAIDHLSDKQLRYLTEVDGVDHFSWVAMAGDDELPAGVARWIRIRDEPTVAEGAVTVVDPFQRHGIGKALLWLGARSAIERGIHAVRVNVLSENDPVMGLLKEFGAGPGRWEQGVLEVDIPLPADLEEFERSPVPEVFRAIARGHIDAELESTGHRARVG
jgi:GNAT superfamily N-acetyltransferase